MCRVIQAMSDADLLSLLVGPRSAQRLLHDAGRSLYVVFNDEEAVRGPDRRAERKVKVAKELVRRMLREALRKRDTLSSPLLVRDFLRTSLDGREYEVFMGIFLDSQNRLIAAEEMFRGTLTQTSVFPREVVKRSLYFNAAAVIFAHNHPSGLAEPSFADEALTRALKQALALVDVKVLDHFIVAGGGVLSFCERGLL